MQVEKQLSEIESIQLITTMINRAKNRFRENGFLYLPGGWVFAAISLSINRDYSILLIVVAIITTWIIPGYLLQVKFKKEN